MAQGSSNTSTFSNAPNSSTGRPRHLRDSVPVFSSSPVPAPSHSVFGTFGPKMAVATPNVRLTDPLRRPSVSARRGAVQISPLLPPSGVLNLVGIVCTLWLRPAPRAIASNAAPRAYLPGSPGPLQLHSSGEIPGQPDNAGTFRAPASPPLWSRRRHTLPAQAQAPPPEVPSDDAASSVFRPHYPPSSCRQ
ncbi:hypothetical protein NDU88_008545 [Pleurodeles waltl]|uniref:Uncharacterized protein n=1 Tax=Pleurodeles waltl TaxID=8319 RepID=A0AAV7NWD5_PLEWA|nr:hypothetical protein NDU88_008545 [Pleurodeles waltl]